MPWFEFEETHKWYVSIRTRSGERVMLAVFQGPVPGSWFQSAPALVSG